MREDICTIPISEVFENGDGCPICRMRKMLEDRIVDYILGAAMMEPDVRIETNRLGFCSNHLQQMMSRRNRLQLGLILETHLKEIENEVFKKGVFGLNNKKSAYSAARTVESCFVCDKVDFGMKSLIKTLFITYNNQLDFRETFRKQEFLCLPHYKMLCESAKEHLSKKPLSDFNEDILNLSKGYLQSLYNDVHEFTKMFDYRNSSDENADFSSVTNSIERAYDYLCAKGEETL